MNNNTLKKIFPEPPNYNYNGLKYDIEGLWSITHPKEAEYISQKIIDILKTTNLNILDMTAGCGGNMISFLKYFKHVTGIEINKERYDMLKNNLNKYNYTNYSLLNDDCINYINNINNNINDYDVFFIDPPWGGPEYKKLDSIELKNDEVNRGKFILLFNTLYGDTNISINQNYYEKYPGKYLSFLETDLLVKLEYVLIVFQYLESRLFYNLIFLQQVANVLVLDNAQRYRFFFLINNPLVDFFY